MITPLLLKTHCKTEHRLRSMRSSSVLLLCLSLFLSQAHAAAIPLPKKPPVSIPKIPKGGLYGVAAQVAATKALEALDWVMTDGAKVKRKTAPADTNAADTNAGTQTSSSELSPNASYPLSYIASDGTEFMSAQAAHRHNIDTFLRENNYVRSRNEKGLFYDKLDVYIGNRGYYGSGVGYYVTSIQAGDPKSLPKNLIGGSLHQISGQIFYKGYESLENIQVSGDYKEKREAARKAVADAIAQALPADDDIEDQPLPDEVETPDVKSKPKAPVVPIPHDEPANDPEYNPQEKDKDKKKDKPKPTPSTRPEKDPKADPKTQPRPSTRPDVKPTPKTDPDKDPKPNTDTEQDPQSDPKADPKYKKNPNKEPKPSTGQKKDPNNEPKPNDQTRPKQDDKQAPAFELPAFCDWAKPVCDFINWFKEPPDISKDDDYKPKIKDLSDLAEQDINKNYYNTDEQCPPDVVVEFPFGNITISYKYYCDFAVKISPLVVALAYIFGAFIIARGR